LSSRHVQHPSDLTEMSYLARRQWDWQRLDWCIFSKSPI